MVVGLDDAGGVAGFDFLKRLNDRLVLFADRVGVDGSPEAVMRFAEPVGIFLDYPGKVDTIPDFAQGLLGSLLGLLRLRKGLIVFPDV